MIALRLDGGKAIGMGHVMRCLSLAGALRAAGEDCCFITADEAVSKFITDAGFVWHCLHARYGAMDDELPVLLPLLRTLRPRFVLADSYAVTEHWMRAVAAVAPLAYLDDEDAARYPVTALINYNLSGLGIDYAGEYAGTGTTLLLGPQYAPLRAAFAGLPPRVVAPTVQNVLVSTGGTDPLNVASTLLQMVAERPAWRGITFHFAVGAMNPNRAALEAAAADLPNVQFHSHVSNFEEMLLHCDAAVAAAGSTLYELCACGTPAVTYSLADNQTPGATAFAAHGLMLNAGDCRENPDFAGAVAAQLDRLCADFALRRSMTAAMQRLIDGNGARRLAEALLRVFC